MENRVPMRANRVAVVGAGFTGLTAAYELAKQGFEVEVYEASEVVGGLVAGFTLNDGFPLERAYHFLYTTDEHMIGMAAELGIEEKLDFYPSSIQAFYEGKKYEFTTAFDLLRFKPLSLIDRIRTGLVGLRLLTLRKWQPLTKITAYEWLCKWNGKRAADLIWKPLLQGKFDVYWDKITMAWLWTRIHVRQTSRGKGEQIERLGYFTGGFRVMVDRWLEELEKRHIPIYTGTPIQQFSQLDGKPTLVVGGESRQYDAVLAALPSNTFARAAGGHPAFTEAYEKQLLDIDYLDAALMVFTTDAPISNAYWHQIHDLDAPFLVFLSLDALVGIENTGGRHIYYLGDYTQSGSKLMSLSDGELMEKWLTGLQEMFPGFSPESVIESHIFRFRNAQHIVGVGYEHSIPSMRTPLPGYYMANFSQVFPEDRGTNYAVRDGKIVAKLIAEDLKYRS